MAAMMEPTSEAVLSPLPVWATASTRGVGDADPAIPVEGFKDCPDVLDGEVENAVLLATVVEGVQVSSLCTSTSARDIATDSVVSVGYLEGGFDVLVGEVKDAVLPGTVVEIIQTLSPSEIVVDK